MTQSRTWSHYLILAPGDLDLDAWQADSLGGAVALCRDVLAGPPSYVDDDGQVVTRDHWPDGVHSPTPGLAAAVAALFGVPVTGQLLGARIYYARLAGGPLEWAARVLDVVAGVQLAAASELWEAPAVVLVLTQPSPAIAGLLATVLPGVPVRWVPDVSPEACALAIRDGLAEAQEAL